MSATGYRNEAQVPESFSGRADGRELPLRLLDSFEFVLADDPSTKVSLTQLKTSGTVIAARGILLQPDSKPPNKQGPKSKLSVQTGPVQDWLIEYGGNPAIWICTESAWYKLVTPAPDYLAAHYDVQRKYDLCIRIADAIYTQPTASLDAITPLLLQPSNDATSSQAYSKEDLHEEAAFIYHQISVWVKNFDLDLPAPADQPQGRGRKPTVLPPALKELEKVAVPQKAAPAPPPTVPTLSEIQQRLQQKQAAEAAARAAAIAAAEAAAREERGEEEERIEAPAAPARKKKKGPVLPPIGGPPVLPALSTGKRQRPAVKEAAGSADEDGEDEAPIPAKKTRTSLAAPPPENAEETAIKKRTARRSAPAAVPLTQKSLDADGLDAAEDEDEPPAAVPSGRRASKPPVPKATRKSKADMITPAATPAKTRGSAHATPAGGADDVAGDEDEYQSDRDDDGYDEEDMSESEEDEEMDEQAMMADPAFSLTREQWAALTKEEREELKRIRRNERWHRKKHERIRAKQEREITANEARGEPPPCCADFRVDPDMVPDVLAIWEMCMTFANVLHLPPFPLSALEAAICPGPLVRTTILQQQPDGPPKPAPVYDFNTLVDDEYAYSAILLRDIHHALMRIVDGHNPKQQVQPEEAKAHEDNKAELWQDRLSVCLEKAPLDMKTDELKEIIQTLRYREYVLLNPQQRLLILKCLTEMALNNEVMREHINARIEALSVARLQKEDGEDQSSGPGRRSNVKPVAASPEESQNPDFWLQWMRSCKLGMRKALGTDYHKRRYWAFGGKAGCWRVWVELDEGRRWGWYEGDSLQALIDWIRGADIEKEYPLLRVLDSLPTPKKPFPGQMPPFLTPQQLAGAQYHLSPEELKLKRPDGYRNLLAPLLRGEMNQALPTGKPLMIEDRICLCVETLMGDLDFWFKSPQWQTRTSQVLEAVRSIRMGMDISKILLEVEAMLAAASAMKPDWMQQLREPWRRGLNRPNLTSREFALHLASLQSFVKEQENLLTRHAFMRKVQEARCPLYFPPCGELVAVMKSGCMLHIDKYLKLWEEHQTFDGSDITTAKERLSGMRPVSRCKIAAIAYRSYPPPPAPPPPTPPPPPAEGEEPPPPPPPPAPPPPGRPPCMFVLLQPSRSDRAPPYEQGSTDVALPIHIDNALPDYVVKIENYDRARAKVWKQGDRFRMYFGGKLGTKVGGSWYKGTVASQRPIDPTQNLLDPWESISVEWDYDDGSAQTKVSPWEIEVDPEEQKRRQEEKKRAEAAAARAARAEQKDKKSRVAAGQDGGSEEDEEEDGRRSRRSRYARSTRDMLPPLSHHTRPGPSNQMPVSRHSDLMNQMRDRNMQPPPSHSGLHGLGQGPGRPGGMGGPGHPNLPPALLQQMIAQRSGMPSMPPGWPGGQGMNPAMLQQAMASGLMPGHGSHPAQPPPPQPPTSSAVLDEEAPPLPTRSGLPRKELSHHLVSTLPPTNEQFMVLVTRFFARTKGVMPNMPSELDARKLFLEIHARGGYDKVCHTKQWRDVVTATTGLNAHNNPMLATKVRFIYERSLLELEEYLGNSQSEQQQHAQQQQQQQHTSQPQMSAEAQLNAQLHEQARGMHALQGSMMARGPPDGRPPDPTQMPGSLMPGVFPRSAPQVPAATPQQMAALQAAGLNPTGNIGMSMSHLLHLTGQGNVHGQVPGPLRPAPALPPPNSLSNGPPQHSLAQQLAASQQAAAQAAPAYRLIPPAAFGPAMQPPAPAGTFPQLPGSSQGPQGCTSACHQQADPPASSPDLAAPMQTAKEIQHGTTVDSATAPPTTDKEIASFNVPNKMHATATRSGQAHDSSVHGFSPIPSPEVNAVAASAATSDPPHRQTATQPQSADPAPAHQTAAVSSPQADGALSAPGQPLADVQPQISSGDTAQAAASAVPGPQDTGAPATSVRPQQPVTWEAPRPAVAAEPSPGYNLVPLVAGQAPGIAHPVFGVALGQQLTLIGTALVGSTLWRRWEGLEGWLEALVLAFDADACEHLLVYDRGQEWETFELVDLRELPDTCLSQYPPILQPALTAAEARTLQLQRSALMQRQTAQELPLVSSGVALPVSENELERLEGYVQPWDLVVSCLQSGMSADDLHTLVSAAAKAVADKDLGPAQPLPATATIPAIHPFFQQAMSKDEAEQAAARMSELIELPAADEEWQYDDADTSVQADDADGVDEDAQRLSRSVSRNMAQDVVQQGGEGLGVQSAAAGSRQATPAPPHPPPLTGRHATHYHAPSHDGHQSDDHDDIVTQENGTALDLETQHTMNLSGTRGRGRPRKLLVTRRESDSDMGVGNPRAGGVGAVQDPGMMLSEGSEPPHAIAEDGADLGVNVDETDHTAGNVEATDDGAVTAASTRGRQRTLTAKALAMQKENQLRMLRKAHTPAGTTHDHKAHDSALLSDTDDVTAPTSPRSDVAAGAADSDVLGKDQVNDSAQPASSPGADDAKPRTRIKILLKRTSQQGV